MSAVSQPLSTNRERWAWYLYDFANSSYAAVVLLAVYSAYFKNEVVGGAEGSRLWGLSISVAMIVVAVLSPIFGAIADFSASKKRFLFIFTSIACAFTSLLFFVQKGDILMGMVFFILAEIGYRSAQVFYNALLTEIAAPAEIGRISGTGWAIGSAGGVVILLIILPLIVLIKGAFIVRVSLVITGLFFALFAVPIFLWLRERGRAQQLPPGENYFSIALQQLRRTIRTARQFREFLKFMLAVLLYDDGIIMALDFAAIIGAVLFGMNQTMLIVFVIIVQITNVIGAYIFGILADRYGCKRTLTLSIIMMILIVIWLYFNQTQTGFLVIGAFAGIAMAGVQSVSRTMVGVLTPPAQSGEFYGFFSIVGRTSSFIGPAVYGWLAAEAALWYERQGVAVTSAEQMGQRVAILSIAVFLAAGLFVLRFVNEERGRATAAAHSA